MASAKTPPSLAKYYFINSIVPEGAFFFAFGINGCARCIKVVILRDSSVLNSPTDHTLNNKETQKLIDPRVIYLPVDDILEGVLL
jgi:hypothetical protein